MVPSCTRLSTRQNDNLLFLIPFIAVLGISPGARAEEQSPTSPKPGDLGDAVIDADPNDDASYLDPALMGDDVIVVWGSRPDKPFDRDTTLRLTGAELKKRGINNLAEALDLLPELHVRAAGRGGRQINIRGARKGSVKILLDGIAISDPYYGNIDLSAIPITDVEQIRVSASPASPIDGPGGPGGVIEIMTSDAVGADSVRARISGSSLPSAEVSATGRMMLSEHLAARVSASVIAGRQDFEVLPTGMATESSFIAENREQSVGVVRVEYRKGPRRLVTDIWTQQVGFVVPPKQGNNILVIEGESQGRLGIAFDDKWQGLKVQARAHYHLLARESTFFEDVDLATLVTTEDLNASRSGLALLVNQPRGEHWHLIGSANLESDHAKVQGFDGQPIEGRATIAQSALAAQYKVDSFDVQSSAGVAVPIGLGAKPWPEFKLASRYAPIKAVSLEWNAGHKGRAPTLRERYQFDIGNRKLGPEKAFFGEMGVQVSPASFVKVSTNAYLRRTNGLIRRDINTNTLINTEDVWIRGIDSQIEGKAGWASGGASWSYAHAQSEVLGTKPLDFFPKHRLSSWLRAALGERGGTTFRIQYFGTQIDGNTELPRRLLLQWSAHYRFLQHYQLSFRAENLTGKEYEQRVGVRAPGRVALVSLQSEWN